MTDRPSRAVTHGFGPFVTWVAAPIADDVHEIHTSRRSRKRLVPLRLKRAEHAQPLSAGASVTHDWSSFWALGRLSWWIAVLFMIGSALFAIGGMQTTWPDVDILQWFNPALLGATFFVGSIFFTAAAYLQFYEALNNDVESTAGDSAAPRPRRFFGWRPRNLGFLASLIQFVGTLLFNMNTLDAMIAGLNWEGEDLLVWTPNTLGCLCFLIASQLAVMEFSHSWFAFRPDQLAWWIVAVNMLGSILFGVSAAASFVAPSSEMISPFIAGVTTFAGAICFLIGAYLLIPEQFEVAEA